MDTKLLDKWLNGTHSAADLQKLEADPAFAAYQKIDRFSKQIEIPAFDTEASLDAVKSKLNDTEQKESKVRTLPLLLKIAAVLVVLLASYVFLYDSANTTIQTQVAETTTIQLPDTSEIVLNENSEVAYDEKTWSESRKLTLTGEAYFKVAKGEKFTVHTPNGDITVLGTEFNVTDQGGAFSVSCYEGAVAVTHQAKTLKVVAGQGVVLKNGVLNSTAVYVNKPEWIDNESSYSDVRIESVLRDLEQKYNITVAAQNIDVTLRFTGSFTHTDLEAALKTITLPLGLTYAIESDKNVIISPSQATK